MSDEIVTENQNQDARTDKPQVDVASADKSMLERAEVVVEEVFGAVGDVFEAIKDEIVEHLGGSSKDSETEENQDTVETKDAAEKQEAEATPTVQAGEVNVASGDMEPSSAVPHHHTEAASQESDMTDAPTITATPVANFAPAADAIDHNATAFSATAAPDTTETSAAPTTTSAEQPEATTTPATAHNDHGDGAGTVVVETVVVHETIVQEADGTQHVEVVEAHEVATVVQGENGEAEVTVAEEYVVASADIEAGEVYDASAADVSDDTTQEADYEASADEVADYEAIADGGTTDTSDNQDSYDAGDAIETHLGDMVTYD